MADNLEVIKCPACGCEMEKIFMPEQNVNLDVCTKGCGGIYFDNREFQKFDEKHEDISPLEKALEGKDFIKVDDDQIRNCPVCGSRMMKNFTSINHDIQVDECYNCGGKFLDNGELEKIRAQYNTEGERTKDILKNLYSEVGPEILIRKTIPQRKTSSVLKGFIIGMLLAFLYLTVNIGVLSDAGSVNSVFVNALLILVICPLISVVINTVKNR